MKKEQTAVEYFDSVNKLATENQGNTPTRLTAVEWLQNQYENCPESFLTEDDFEQAKEMEKKQINEACYYGYYIEELYDTRNYYNDTYLNRNK